MTIIRCQWITPIQGRKFGLFDHQKCSRAAEFIVPQECNYCVFYVCSEHKKFILDRSKLTDSQFIPINTQP